MQVTKFIINIMKKNPQLHTVKTAYFFNIVNNIIKNIKINKNKIITLGQTTIKTPVKKLTEDNELVKATELYIKYTSLSAENQRCLDKFLEYLLLDDQKK